MTHDEGTETEGHALVSAAGGGRRARGRDGAGGELELTVLDLLPRGPGRSEGEALADTLTLAERAEGFGYARFWMAEHQGPRSPALGCPELLVGPAAARTRRLRVGTAGVLLRYYSPLKVAETFRCLEALHPGRIDLGVARGHADGALGAPLLDGRPEPADAAAYRAKVGRLLYFLGAPSDPGGPGRERPVPGAPPALPAPVTRPEVWLLGAGDQGAALAAEFGAAFSFALFLRNDVTHAARAIAAYRAGFRPSAALATPRWSIAVSGVCAPTQAQAARLLAGAANQLLAARATVVGPPARCRAALEALGRRLGTRRYVFLTLTDDLASRAESHRLLARAFGLGG
jgi:luciferase family oxidoreductase group 1